MIFLQFWSVDNVILIILFLLTQKQNIAKTTYLLVVVLQKQVIEICP